MKTYECIRISKTGQNKDRQLDTRNGKDLMGR